MDDNCFYNIDNTVQGIIGTPLFSYFYKILGSLKCMTTLNGGGS